MSSSSKRKQANSTSPEPAAKAPRAAVACERCRLKKLRCTGGFPCRSCQAAAAKCTFELGVEKLDLYLGSGDIRERVAELERTVAALTARLDHLAYRGDAVPHSTLASAPCDAPTATSIATATSSRIDELPTERLLAATNPRPGHVAPFPPFMFHPSVWENRSRSPSPLAGGPGKTSRLGPTTYEAKISVNDDPLVAGLVSPQLALALYRFFFEHCHPMMPIIQYQSTDHYDDLQRKSPFLFTVILAVACRFYHKHSTSYPRPDRPPISASVVGDVAHMAFAHLGASLFWKQHQLADVQSVQLISLWVLSRPGQSPDQWLVSGHCSRLAYRIGMNKVSETAVDAPDRANRLESWQTWLAWYSYDGFLSLGFGRPQMVPPNPDQVNETAFVQAMVMNGHRSELELQNARFIASLVQLSMLAATSQAFGLYDDGPGTARFLADLNHEVTDWFAVWLPSIVLSPTRHILELYGNHLRLCINTIALNVTLSASLGSMTASRAPTMTRYIILGEQAASTIISCQQSLLGTGSVCPNDYVNLIFCQAGVFLLRLLLAPLPFELDRQALRMSIQACRDLFMQHDMCEYDIGRRNSWMLSEFCRSSNVDLDPTPGTVQQQEVPFDLDWLFAAPGQSNVSAEGTTDINQLFGLPLHEGWADNFM